MSEILKNATDKNEHVSTLYKKIIKTLKEVKNNTFLEDKSSWQDIRKYLNDIKPENYPMSILGYLGPAADCYTELRIKQQDKRINASRRKEKLEDAGLAFLIFAGIFLILFSSELAEIIVFIMSKFK